MQCVPLHPGHLDLGARGEREGLVNLEEVRFNMLPPVADSAALSQDCVSAAQSVAAVHDDAARWVLLCAAFACGATALAIAEKCLSQYNEELHFTQVVAEPMFPHMQRATSEGTRNSSYMQFEGLCKAKWATAFKDTGTHALDSIYFCNVNPQSLVMIGRNRYPQWKDSAAAFAKRCSVCDFMRMTHPSDFVHADSWIEVSVPHLSDDRSIGSEIFRIWTS
ncbi:hypothetical protein Efla_002100 [Eimeria flavescens]